MMRWFPLLLAMAACTTVQRTEDAQKSGVLATGFGGVIASGMHDRSAKPPAPAAGLNTSTVIQIRGTVMCSKGNTRKHADYRAEVHHQGKLAGASDLDPRLSFDIIRYSPPGAHEARLVEKRTNRVLTRQKVMSSLSEDRFDIVFENCAATAVR